MTETPWIRPLRGLRPESPLPIPLHLAHVYRPLHLNSESQPLGSLPWPLFSHQVYQLPLLQNKLLQNLLVLLLFILFLGSVGQKFRQDTVEMACLCSMISVASAEKTKGVVIIWRYLHSCLEVDDCQPGLGWAFSWNDCMRPLHVVSLHGLVWASLQHGGWFQDGHPQRASDWSCITFDDLAFGHITSLPWSQAHPSSGRGSRDPTSQWEESHSVRRTCRMGDRAAPIAAKYYLG